MRIGVNLGLKNAASTPLPPTLPRVVVGCGGSRRLIRNAVGYADEINVYADEDLIRFARHDVLAPFRSACTCNQMDVLRYF